MQEHHDLADDLLLGPRILDALAALGADSVDFFQPDGVLLDDRENFLPKFVHQLLGIDGADALDHAAAEIFFDALSGSRFRAFEELRLELQPVFAVAHPAALRRDPLPGVDGGQRADHGDEIPVAFGFDAQHREAVLLVVEGDALDQAGDAVPGVCCSLATAMEKMFAERTGARQEQAFT